MWLAITYIVDTNILSFAKLLEIKGQLSVGVWSFRD